MKTSALLFILFVLTAIAKKQEAISPFFAHCVFVLVIVAQVYLLIKDSIALYKTFKEREE